MFRAIISVLISAIMILLPATVFGTAPVGESPNPELSGAEHPLGGLWESGPAKVPHAPLRINSNADFDEAHGVVNWDTGNGTEGNPWIIENWDIDGTGYGYCIYVGNTTDHFIVRNCTLYGASGDYVWPYSPCAGLELMNVENCAVENNTVYGNAYDGIALNYSRNIKISNNTAHSNGQDGVLLCYSEHNLIAGNNLSANSWNGTDICDSANNTIEWNILSWNIYNGLYLWNSTDNTLRNNTMEYNAIYGFNIDSSNNNVLCDNTGSNNSAGGILLLYSSGCDVFTNTVSRNAYSGIEIISSMENNICGNAGSENGDSGINLYDCTANRIYSNRMNANNYEGIFLWNSTLNSIAGNAIWANIEGISLWSSAFNFVDGNTVWGNDYGMFLSYSTNNTVANNSMFSNQYGIYLSLSGWNVISNNTASANVHGVSIRFSSDRNTVCGNQLFENIFGISIVNNKDNVIANNTIARNDNGLVLNDCMNTRVHHNNFVCNDLQATDNSPNNWWNDSYPSGGNYWSDYSGEDAMSGPLQNIPGSDSMGDTPYVLDNGVADHYPLMHGESIFTVNLVTGWNLISIPLVLKDDDVQDVLASVDGTWDVVKYYDNMDKIDPWKTYRQGASTNDLAEIDSQKGYWVHVIKNCTLVVFGAASVSTEITLHAGWNLVGYPSLTERVMSEALWGTGADRVEVFDPTDPELLREMGPGEMMAPGMGYWVHAVSDAVWTINW